MSARRENSRAGFRLPGRGGPLVPLVGIVVGVVALTAAVTLGGEDSSSTTDAPDTMAATVRKDPAMVPARNTCALHVGDAQRTMSVAAARTLTQIAAVGWQVKAPEEMVARVLDVANAKPGTTMSTTDALDLFTREDTTAPTAAAVAAVRALAEPGALTCVFDLPPVAAESKGKTGLTPRADAIRQGVLDAFGKLTISGYGAKAKSKSPAEAAGRAIDVAVPAAVATHSSEAGAGWVLAHWLAARGADYKLDTIAYDDHVWRPTTGWQATAPGQPQATPARPGRVYVAVTPGTSAKSTTTPAKAAKKAKNSSP